MDLGTREGEKGNVFISVEKLGFTCSVLSSADGKIHLFRFIWQGKTENVHAAPDHPHPRILQQH